MSRSRHPLTPEVEKSILSYVRAGGFPHVAAEAAGVPREVFEGWLARGEGPRAPARYRDFAAAVRQAHAQARLGAEVAAHGSRPLDWLKSGPGRQAPGRPGWTNPARAAPAGGPGGPLLLAPEVQALVAALEEALGPYPEARAAAAGKMGPVADRPPNPS